MADRFSIVEQLKQTKKGRLKYNQQNWNEILEETSKTPELHVSPFSIKASSRLATVTTERNMKPSIGQQARKVSSETPHLKMPSAAMKTNELTDNKNNKNQQKQNDRLTTPPVSPEYSLQDLNKSYDESLHRLTNLRLQNMKNTFSKINLEHQSQLDDINQRSEERAHYGRYQVETHRNLPRESKEVSEFERKWNQRKLVADRQAQQAELEKKAIEDQRTRLEEMKHAIREKKKVVATIGEEVKLLVENAANVYNINKNQLGLPDVYKQLVSRMISEYDNQFIPVLKSAIYDDGGGLEPKYRAVIEKAQFLKDCASKCDALLKKVEEERKAEEKKRLEEEALKKKQAAEEEAKRKAEEAQKQKEEASKPPTSNAPPPAYSHAPAATTNRSVPTVQEAAPDIAPLYGFMEKDIKMFTTKDAFDTYLLLRKLVTDTEKKHQAMSKSTDAAVKKEKFDLFKVVNTQINAISDESPKHLMDKILKLNTLLTNGDVVFSGKKISTKGNETALALVKDLTAKKLVMQGQSQVASSFKTAFPIAAVCAGLWTLFPDVGDLLLGYFYLKCPFLVPLHLPKTEKISTTEYYKILGYEVDGDKVEEDDKYLSKLSGYVRLYASIIQMEMPPDLAGRGHPHGLENGWIWFTRVLNLEPRELITATIIYDFLEVAGHAMMTRFGKQFEKLLAVVMNDLMPKINAVTPPHSKAGATRLKMFLDRCLKEGKIKPPEGVLTQRWWTTGR